MNIKNKSVKFEKFFANYLLTLSNTVGKINLDNLYKAANLITKTIKKNKFIYICGNGGSAAIANHHMCDYLNTQIWKQRLKHSKISIYSKIDNYGISEDINHILLHLLMQSITKTNLNLNKEKLYYNQKVNLNINKLIYLLVL